MKKCGLGSQKIAHDSKKKCNFCIFSLVGQWPLFTRFGPLQDICLANANQQPLRPCCYPPLVGKLVPISTPTLARRLDSSRAMNKHDINKEACSKVWIAAKAGYCSRCPGRRVEFWEIGKSSFLEAVRPDFWKPRKSRFWQVKKSKVWEIGKSSFLGMHDVEPGNLEI